MNAHEHACCVQARQQAAEIDRLRAELTDRREGSLYVLASEYKVLEARLATIVSYIDTMQDDPCEDWDTSLTIMENIRAAATGNPC